MEERYKTRTRLHIIHLGLPISYIDLKVLLGHRYTSISIPFEPLMESPPLSRKQLCSIPSRVIGDAVGQLFGQIWVPAKYREVPRSSRFRMTQDKKVPRVEVNRGLACPWFFRPKALCLAAPFPSATGGPIRFLISLWSHAMIACRLRTLNYWR